MWGGDGGNCVATALIEIKEETCSQSTYGTLSALTGISWTRSCTMPNLLATLENFYGTTSLSRSTVKIHFRNVSIRVMMRRMYTISFFLAQPNERLSIVGHLDTSATTQLSAAHAKLRTKHKQKPKQTKQPNTTKKRHVQ